MSDTDEPRLPGAPAGNQNAAKDDDDGLTAVLHLRVHPDEKAAWNKLARKDGKRLAAWVREKLNALDPAAGKKAD